MNCWKCGKPTALGAAECGECELGFKPIDESDEGEFELVEIDWNKVQTVEDMKVILREIGFMNCVVKDSPEAEKIKRFLKDENKS